MVDTDQISTSADEPGLVIRNEDVFIEKVRERVALAEATGHLLSPVLLLQTGRGEELHEALRAATEAAGTPAVTDTDHVGRTHAMWPVAGAAALALVDLAGGGELVVADGNHRSLAAQTGGLRRFLAVITTPASVAIQPYHRLVSRTRRYPLTSCCGAWPQAGATVRRRHGGSDDPGARLDCPVRRRRRTWSGCPRGRRRHMVDGWTTPWSSGWCFARRARPGARRQADHLRRRRLPAVVAGRRGGRRPGRTGRS